MVSCFLFFSEDLWDVLDGTKHWINPKTSSFIALWPAATLKGTHHICVNKQMCALWKGCVCALWFIFYNRFEPWCNGASGRPRTACVLSDYEQIRSTRLSLFGCVCQNWDGGEQTAHGVAMPQWFAFTCSECHPWLTWTHDYVRRSRPV